ncbi:MAG: hypothetical protein ACFCUW_01065 [Kiloniellaceae bacterium]
MNHLEFAGDYRQPRLGAHPRAHEPAGAGEAEFTFGDFIDIINPLQHIPLVSTLYREITGDEISPHARILGGTLFGGAGGFLSSIANVLYEEIAGEDVGETVIAFFTGPGEPGEEDPGEPQFADVDDGVFPAAGDDAMALPAPLETSAGPAQALPPAPQTGADAAAVLPQAAPGVLTGQDALNALFLDLRGGAATPPALPLAPAEAPAEARSLPLPGRAGQEGQAAEAMKAYPLPPRHVRVTPPAPPPAAAEPAGSAEAAPHPLVFAQESAGGDVADRMMQALDKYRTMAQQDRAATRRDRDESEEELRWQSDPAGS